ncbi:MAG TPA: hypothetical protein PKA49_06485 [Tepidiformaceae bacterium]|nr:hypothetical protein [Tepidiformaceae bacterium]
MEWDLGPGGLLVLLAMSAAFAIVAQAVTWRRTHRMWLIAGVTYFVSGLVISEVFFGWATEEDLQPNIDGLSFDEVLLLGLLAGVIVVVAAWIIAGRRHPTRPAP